MKPGVAAQRLDDFNRQTQPASHENMVFFSAVVRRPINSQGVLFPAYPQELQIDEGHAKNTARND